jgi:hypothetical protein
MLNVEIEKLMADLQRLRAEYREETVPEKRTRLFVERGRLWGKVYAMDVAEGRSADALLKEVNALYEREVSDRNDVAVQLRLLWCAIEKRRRSRAA